MRVSTKGRYALRVMIDLALYNNGTNISLKEIAKRQGISQKYLEQIISILHKAGYVNSERGNNGGYRLAVDPKECTVGSVLRLTEGSLAPVACLDDNSPQCERVDVCTTVSFWRKLNDAINSVVDSVTIADLVQEQMSKNVDYVI